MLNQAASTITLRRWGGPNEAAFAEPVFVHDSETLPLDLSSATIVLRSGALARARALLERGARQVLVGNAALLDSRTVETLSMQFGTARVGLWVPARRTASSWSLDRDSNADFSCITPSRAAPGWEVLKSDGSGSGTDAHWWIGQMLGRGASTALVAIDMHDDDDLNICAGMAQCFGPALWLTPLAKVTTDMTDWVRFGKARNLAIRQVRHDDPLAMRTLRQHLSDAIGMVA